MEFGAVNLPEDMRIFFVMPDIPSKWIISSDQRCSILGVLVETDVLVVVMVAEDPFAFVVFLEFELENAQTVTEKVSTVVIINKYNFTRSSPFGCHLRCRCIQRL
jgi:hypothetical protein